VIGYLASASAELAAEAVEKAAEAFATWRLTDPAARAAILFKGASLLRQRKFEFNAWLVYEVGKNWAEADGETAEAIDFLEFYGREMLRLAQPQPLTVLAGEDNRLTYVPLGVGVVIPPWNFPLAIMAGMTCASLVAGNTVVLKPASTAPVVAARFVSLMHDAGLPDEVLNFITGSGNTIGDVLVDHKLTRFVSFTGSRDVGLRINGRLAVTQPGQIWIKRLIAEMGGKDGIVVDADADLDAAAAGIVNSAFGFQGQKCSAASRAILHQDIYDEVVRRVVALTKKLTVGLATDNASVGAVIDNDAYEKVQSYLAIGATEGNVLVGGHVVNDPALDGFYIEPTVIADVDPSARILHEEIFGPVLAICKAEDFTQAIAIANDTDYGLTGSVYSTNRAHLEYARHNMHVGNLYFNRKSTGALVGVHPFGGFNMSGTDSKAGGRDYLLLFTQAKIVSEVL
jgi:1-pyrroline-5-carboxylate dehydrogenase